MSASASSPPPSRGRRYAVRGLLVTGTILAVFAIFAVFANRQVLNADNWAHTSSALLANKDVRDQVSDSLVDQLYANVDVSGQVASALPARLEPLAGPLAGGLREVAQRTTDRLLTRPRVQGLWEDANRLTAQQFINIAEGKSGAITSQGNAVILDLRVVLVNLIRRLGLPSSVEEKLPANAGRIKIMSGDQVTTLQDGASALRGLAFVLPIVSLGMLGLAVFLAHGRRRHTLMVVGVDLIAVGVFVLIARNLVGNNVVDSLVKTDSVKPAGHAVWDIGTSMLRDVAGAVVITGIPLVFAAWLAGASRPATALRRAAAPTLRERPGVTYSVAAVIVLLVLAWGPIPATHKLVPVLIMIGLLVVGVEALRRQTAEEFPDAPTASASGPVLRLRGNGNGAARVESLERLTALHDKGALTDAEFAAQKAALGV